MNNTTTCQADTRSFVNLFTQYGYDKPICTKGESYEYRVGIDINYSSILTRLIQEAGRYCESYASDLFIYWKRIDTQLDNESIEDQTLLFGFREFGVDSKDVIQYWANDNPHGFGNRYRSIWRLDIEVTVDPDYWWNKPNKTVAMKLYRVSAPSGWTYMNFKKELSD